MACDLIMRISKLRSVASIVGDADTFFSREEWLETLGL
jgi:hypothetical protein